MLTGFKYLIFLFVVINVISCNKSPEKLLIKAAEQGNEGKALFFLKNGVPVDAKDKLGYTALMKAASNGQEEVVKLLLVHKANVNATSVFGTTALMQAAWNGQVKIVKTLVENKADIHIQGAGGWTALYFAALSDKGHPEIVRFLLKKGADPNIKDYMGLTLLRQVDSNRHPEINQALRHYGAQE